MTGFSFLGELSLLIEELLCHSHLSLCFT